MNFLKLQTAVSFVGYVINDFDAWVPEVWAQETLAILEENMVIGNIVHRSFSSEIASFGDVVNTRRPNQYVAERKGANDDVVEQISNATNIAVTLNQHIHVSYNVKDTEESLSFVDMISQYLKPAGLAVARKIDKILLNQVHQFYVNRDPGGNNTVGNLQGMTLANVKRSMLEVGEQLDKNRCPEEDRWLLVDPSTKTNILELDLFTGANTVGDDGTKLRKASLGEILGFNVLMAQNVPRVNAATVVVNADELASDAAAGDTVINLDSGAVVTVGQYILLEGDEMPYRVLSIATNAVTINRPLRVGVLAAASNLSVSVLDTVDLAGHTGVSAYPVDYDKKIKVDASANTPVSGMLCSFNTGTTVHTAEYGIVDVTVSGADTFIDLDRALEEAVLDGDTVGYGHIGSTNFALHRNALAMVIRPLAPPRSGAGAISGIADFNNLAVRVTISYNGTAQKHLVTLDVLFGTKILDRNYACPWLG